MLTIVSWVGWLASSAMGGVVPGISPKLIMWAACALAALVLLSAPAGAVWIHMHGEIKAARAEEHAASDLRASEERRLTAEAMTQILDRIAIETPARPDTPAEEAAWCKRNPKLCRTGEE